MRQSRFTETRIIAILKEAEAGLSVTEVCRKHGVSSATYYKWKAKYGGLDASELTAAGGQQRRLLPCGRRNGEGTTSGPEWPNPVYSGLSTR